MALCFRPRAAALLQSHARPEVERNNWDRSPVWSGPWTLSMILGGKGAALVFEKEGACSSPSLPAGCATDPSAVLRVLKFYTGSLRPARQLTCFVFHICLNAWLNWHLNNNMKVWETPWTLTSLYRHIWLHLTEEIFFFVLILQKNSLVSITIYSAGILGLFFVPLHLIIFSRVQTFYDMQILTRPWLLFIQTSIINKLTTAAYNVEEFYSYHNPVPSSTANITIIFKMSLNIILSHLKHRNPGVKWLHFSWDCL